MISVSGARVRATTLLAAAAPLALLLVTRAGVELANPAVTLAQEDTDASARHESRSPLVAGEQAVLAQRHADSLYAMRVDCPFVDQAVGRGDAGPTQPRPFDTRSDGVPVPSIHVTSIIGGREPMAIIDGRTMRLGDVVSPGWILTAIIARQRRVEITHRSGRTHSVLISL